MKTGACPGSDFDDLLNMLSIITQRTKLIKRMRDEPRRRSLLREHKSSVMGPVGSSAFGGRLSAFEETLETCQANQKSRPAANVLPEQSHLVNRRQCSVRATTYTGVAAAKSAADSGGPRQWRSSGAKPRHSATNRYSWQSYPYGLTAWMSPSAHAGIDLIFCAHSGRDCTSCGSDGGGSAGGVGVGAGLGSGAGCGSGAGWGLGSSPMVGTSWIPRFHRRRAGLDQQKSRPV
jgi:hypothetical protein